MAFDAGSVIARFRADLTNFKQGVNNAKKETKSFKSDMGSLVGTVTKVGAALGIAFGAATLINGIKDAINASASLERSMLGLRQVANAFGQDAAGAEQAAKDLANDGLMTVAESAEALKNLLATGFSLPEAINLMNTFKDASAANRQGTLGFGEAIVGATIGIKNQNSVLVDNVGISKNLSVILREQGLSVDDLQNVTSDAAVRQKLYNGLLNEGAIFSGAAAANANTLGGRMSQLNTALFNASAAIGDALAPVVSDLIDAFVSWLIPATEWLRAHMVDVQATVIALAGALQILGTIAIGVARMIAAVFTFNLGEMKNAFYDTLGGVSQTFTRTQDRITTVAEKSYRKQEDVAKKSFSNQSAAHNKKSQQIAKDLEKETEKFEREMEKREKDFKDRLADLIRAHLEKKADLEKDIADENRDFSEKMSDRKKDFDERMVDMKTSHEEKVADIMAQMEEEQAKGDEMDAKKIASLQAALAKENAEYDAQKLKEEQRFAEENARLQRDHDEKVAGYQKQLNEENEILKAHEADVAAVKNQAKEDDITRLKNQFKEENEEATKEHARRMDEIAERGQALGDTLGATTNAGLAAQKGAIVGTMDDIGKTAASTFAKGITDGARKAGEDMVKNFIRGIGDKALAGMAKFQGLLESIPGVKEAADWVRGRISIPGFAEGGTVPGVRGEPQLIMAHGQERIIGLGERDRETSTGLPGGVVIQIDMTGALISDENGAMRIGEKVGDAIIKKLNTQIRY